MRKRLASIFIGALLCLTAVLPAFAAENGSVTVLLRHEDQPVAQAQFQIYRVAVWDGSAYTVTYPFSDYAVTMPEDPNSAEWKTLASTLAAYAARDGLAPIAAGQTDETGSVTFSDLTVGLYMVVGAPVEKDKVRISPQSTLVSVPFTKADGTSEFQVTTEPKYDAVLIPEEPIVRRALKVWNDKGSESARPSEITVQLLCDGKVYAEQTLNSANGWSYTWEKLDADHDWQLTEKDVPQNYTVQMQQQGDTFIVTNTVRSDTPSQTPPGSQTPTDSQTLTGSSDTKLPQTGLLWWPVPVLAVLGTIALFSGIFLLLKPRHDADA